MLHACTHANEGIAEKRLDEGTNRTLCSQDGRRVLGRNDVETQFLVEVGRILEREQVQVFELLRRETRQERSQSANMSLSFIMVGTNTSLRHFVGW